MSELNKDFSHLMRVGWVIILFGLGGVVLWATFATLQSAAIANGVLEPSGGVVAVQHLDGGIIKHIHVKEGDLVKKGDLLVSLDDTQAKVQFERLKQRLEVAKVEKHRLALEIYEKEWSLPEVDSQFAKEVIHSQKQLFTARMDSYLVQVDLLDQKVKEYDNEIQGINEELISAEKQMEIVQERINDLSRAKQRQAISKTERLKLEASLAKFKGTSGRLKASVSRTEQQIAEVHLNKVKIKRTRLEKITDEIKTNHELLADLQERMKAASDILQRQEIHADVDGKVSNLAFRVPGEIIQDGDEILKIVPVNLPMLIRARIDPDDIDIVHAGLSVDIRLTAFSVRRTTPFKGKVLNVSADKVVLPNQEAYYEAIIDIDFDTVEEFDESELHSGMMAQLSIITGERTVIEYLFAPVIESMSRSMKEQ
jgi:HlyD family type I secretion membrane fusion protein